MAPIVIERMGCGPRLVIEEPAPEIIAAEIVEDLQAALDQFAQIAADLNATRGRGFDT